jgi:methylthioribose-1-phosphate isomerase
LKVKKQQQSQNLELARKVWQMRVEGAGAYEISQALAVHVNTVKSLLTRYESEVLGEIKENVETSRSLAIQRYEQVLTCYVEVMKAGKVQVSKTNSRGETYTDEDWRYCLQAGHLVLKAIEGIAKLRGLCDPPPEAESAKLNDKMMLFIKDVMPSVKRIVDAQPLETEILAIGNGNGSKNP